jgi:hypothetical protein
VKALLRFLGWATLAFLVAWKLAPRYQLAIADLAGRIAAPRGAEIEWVDLELFFPFDLSIFVALCLASVWVGWRARLRSLGIGLLALVAIELLALVVGMKSMLAVAGQAPARIEEVSRFVSSLIRFVGLVAAGAVWMVLLGWQRFPQFTRQLDRRRAAQGRHR